MKIIAVFALLALTLSASAQSIGGMSGIGGGIGGSSAGGGGGGGCTADGKTDWSNACDLPLGIALGVL